MKKVILLSYGSPERIDDVPEYLSGIFNGKPVPEKIMEENIKKYEMVNGISPSNQIIKNLKNKLGKLLARYGDFEIIDAYKHWHPGIEETVSSLDADYEEIIALPLFAFKSNNIRKSYEIPVKKAMEGKNMKLRFINGLDYSILASMWVSEISKYVYDFDNFLFTAHSLPLIDDESDYQASLERNAGKISDMLGIEKYYTAFYSQGPHGKWIEPSIYSKIDLFKEDKINNLLVSPIGFLYEHLEILYDLDVKYKEFLESRGIKYARARTPSDSDGMAILLKNAIMGVEGDKENYY
ncbi:ferrochelatase [Ferroplasma acidiphilum]|uniref:Ferrochelatase n=2 Tax=Ferroplasma TaxID=74968 RepID=S0ATM8_FERAC|nr:MULTISPECIES: ferrochelatase [Ferroplasma]AGO61464.1 ferrochelatase [Ferroplasma acidarmanus Fer1]NOL60044.1 ferrochelatase [Ferroplasma acidiphilum]WMT53292.1 MAG: ferrochelatase [Ferroplasma acidiphilum]